MRLGALLPSLSLLLTACAAREATSGQPGVDDYGDTVRAAGTRPPARVVSLSPGTTELVFALGAGARLVGRTRWDSWPDSARLVPDVGPGLRPNVEAVLARRPDLVILYASNDNHAAAATLRRAGVSVVAVKTDRIADFRRAASLLGTALGETARAATAVDTVLRTLDRVRAATAPLPRVRVYWHVWDAPLITIGRGSYLDELLTIAGGRNVYGDLPAASPQVALEDVISRDPDVVLAGPEGAATIGTEPRWQGVGAVRRGRVLVVDTALVGRPSVRLGEAAVSLARLLHPGILR